MRDDLTSWGKLAFFSFCLALSILILHSVFFGSVGRYRPLDSNGKLFGILDTVSGAVYNLRDGKLISTPHK